MISGEVYVETKGKPDQTPTLTGLLPNPLLRV